MILKLKDNHFMKSTKNTKYSNVKNMDTIARPFKRIRKLRTITRTKPCSTSVGHLTKIEDNKFVGTIYIDKDYNLCQRVKYPNIEIKFTVVKRRDKGTKDVWIIHRLPPKPREKYGVQIKRT